MSGKIDHPRIDIIMNTEQYKAMERSAIDKLKNLSLEFDPDDPVIVECIDRKTGSGFSMEATKLEDGKIYGTVCEWEYNARDYDDIEFVELTALTLWGLCQLIDEMDKRLQNLA